MLTVRETAQRVEDIRNTQDDFERAHDMEDELWHDVLTAIATGHKYARTLACAALATREIPFNRYTA